MSINIAFKGKLRTGVFSKLSTHDFEGILQGISRDYECTLEKQSEQYKLDICPDGFITIEMKGDSFTGESQTNVAGPGFHKNVVSIMDAIKERSSISLKVEDEADYYTERDFNKLKTEHFHGWLQTLLEVVRLKDDSGAVCWPIDYYLPVDSAVGPTPMGPFSSTQIQSMLSSSGIESFAREFFVWDSEDKDSLFYRNTALNLLWKECFFKPSSRSDIDNKINGRIIKAIEHAASLDNSLPLPIKEYEQICALHGKEPVKLQNPQYALFEQIGYRRGPVSYSYGNWRIVIDGGMLQGTESDSTIFFYDATKTEWYNFRATGYFVEKGMLEFHPDYAKIVDDGKTGYVLSSDGIAVRAKYGETEENGEKFYMLQAQLLHQNKTLIITCCFNNAAKKEWALDTIKQIRIEEPGN